MISPELLRRLPYFAGLPDEALRSIAGASSEQSYRASEALFREAERAEHVFILTAGEVDIVYELNDGEQKVVDTVVAGDLLSWSGLVEPYLTTAAAVARTDATALRVDAVALRALCEEDPALGYHLMREVVRTLVHRLDGARVQLAAMT